MKDLNLKYSISMFDNSLLPACAIRVLLDGQGKPADGVFLYCNQALAQLERRSREELEGLRFTDLIPQGDRGVLELYYQAAYEKKPVSLDTPPREIGICLHVDCIPVEEPGVCMCIVHNTWKEQEYRKRLERQITSFRNVHDALTSGAWNLMYDRKWNLVSVTWSDMLRRMLGFESTADFPNTFEAWANRLHPEDKEPTMEAYRRTVGDRTGKTVFDVEYRLMAKTGEYHWFRAAGALSRREDGSPQSFDGVFVNMDDKHAAGERLQQVLAEAQKARQEAELESEIISSVSRLYFAIYRIDLQRDFYEEISADSSVHRLTGHEGKAQAKMNELCAGIVHKDYRGGGNGVF